MCLKYGQFSAWRAYKPRAYKKKQCVLRKAPKIPQSTVNTAKRRMTKKRRKEKNKRKGEKKGKQGRIHGSISRVRVGRVSIVVGQGQ